MNMFVFMIHCGALPASDLAILLLVNAIEESSQGLHKLES
jgi:hypothetical protein